MCLTVKKETKNKGKRFYSCQDRKCEMFLWEDAAKARERDAILLHNCRSENGITSNVRPKTPEPAPSLDLLRSAGRRLTDAKITDYAGKQGRQAKPQAKPQPQQQQQRVFRGLDDPRESYPSDLFSDSDDTAEEQPAAPRSSSPPSSSTFSSSPAQSQAQNRQRSYLSQPGPVCADISQTLRDSTLASAPRPELASGPMNPPVTPTAKRKRDVSHGDKDDVDNSDEFGGHDLNDSDTERQLARITDESARKRQKLVQGAGTIRKDACYETPSARRITGVVGGGGGDDDEGIRNDLGLPTPMSRRPGLLISSEGAGRVRRVGFASSSPSRRVDGVKEDEEDEETQSDAEDPTTPTPYRKTDALAGAAAAAAPITPSTSTAGIGIGTGTGTGAHHSSKSPAAGGHAGADDYPKIADEVMSLLMGQPVSESTKRTLRAAMKRHEMRVKGVARGREAARALITEREGRVAELQARVVGLENARRMDRERMRELSALGERLMRLSEGDE